MSKVDKLMTEIERFPQEEFTELVRRLSDTDWERWDKEIETDSEAGRWISFCVSRRRGKPFPLECSYEQGFACPLLLHGPSRRHVPLGLRDPPLSKEQ